MHVRGSVHVLKFRAPYDVENLKFWIYVSGWGNFFFSLSFFEFTLNYYNSRFLQFKALTFVKNGLLLIKYLQWIMYQRWKRDRARMSFNDGWYSRIYEESLWIWAHQRRNEIKSSSPHSTLSLSYFWISNLHFNFDRKMEWGSSYKKKLWKFQFQLQCQLIGFVLFKLNIHTYYVLRRYVCIITNVTMYAQELRGKKYLFRKNDNVKAKQIETITKRESTEKLAQPPAI